MLLPAPMRSWLTFALLSLVAGCAMDHGRGASELDAGWHSVPADAGMCMGTPEIREGDVQALICPASVSTGDRVVVSLTSGIALCCPDSAALPPVVSGHDAEVTIGVPYQLCDCCRLCRCVGSSITRDVVVSEAASGSQLRVTAGTQSCTIVIGAPAMCAPVSIAAAFAPAAVALGGEVPVHVATIPGAGTGCSCAPRVSLDPSGAVALAACGCCLDCPCIDEGYEATLLLAPPPSVGPTTIALAQGGPLSTTIVDPARCTTSGVTVTELVPLAPSATLIRSGSAGWVELHGFDRRCCGEPLELVTPTLAPDGSIDLTLAECNPDPCDCAPDRMADASTAVYLGQLTPGTHSVRAGAASTTITVP
jgi:hypothetical protein